MVKKRIRKGIDDVRLRENIKRDRKIDQITTFMKNKRIRGKIFLACFPKCIASSDNF